jgi:hypothetical protein
MLRETIEQVKPKRRRPPVPDGIAAKELGVTRTHLNLVIHGHRKSKRLRRRYRLFLRKVAACL